MCTLSGSCLTAGSLYPTSQFSVGLLVSVSKAFIILIINLVCAILEIDFNQNKFQCAGIQTFAKKILLK